MTESPSPLTEPGRIVRDAAQGNQTGWIRWLPGFKTLGQYESSWLRRDLVAGLVMTTMLVPVGIAYAEASGLPGINGLYATIVPLLAYALFGPSRILVLGVAYKRDIDDVRESPALDVIRLLEERGAHVEFHDPFVHEFREEEHVRKGVELSDEMLRWADAIVIVTDHLAVDYQRVVDHATLVVDTRNVTSSTRPGRARVVGLASTARAAGANA